METTALQTELNIVLLLAFLCMLAGRSLAMRKRGIRAIVFGKTDKRDFLLVLVVLLLVYPAIAKAAGLPMWSLLLEPFWDTPAPGWVGLALCVLAIVGFAASLKSFGDSFRVGIDVERPDKLVTTGMFAYSRNPLYLCIILFFTGSFLTHRNIVVLAALIIFLLAINRQIRREEDFLKKHYGAEFDDYCEKVRRFI